MSTFEPFSLDQLTIFLAVVEERGFSAAARTLGRVQSAVSHSVASLEQTLGTELFDRSHRPLELTEAGRRLAAEARIVLAQARELRSVASAISGGTEARLSITVDALYPRPALARALAEFHDAFPAVLLRVDTELLDQVIARIESGESELAIANMGETQNAPGFDVQPVGSVELWGVCASGHPLASEPAPQRADRLQQAVQVVLSERTASSDDRGVLASRTWRVTDLQTKAALIEAGIGWGNLPADLAEPAIAAGRLHRLHPAPWLDGHYRVPLHSIVRSDRPIGPAGAWLRERLVL
ncbi:MAG: LysR family transcriptional regulator [Deltaproteobacteria bacterium]|nr:LysR family transcriptional regulator [Deltaproteobacteria bacterium]